MLMQMTTLTSKFHRRRPEAVSRKGRLYGVSPGPNCSSASSRATGALSELPRRVEDHRRRRESYMSPSAPQCAKRRASSLTTQTPSSMVDARASWNTGAPSLPRYMPSSTKQMWVFASALPLLLLTYVFWSMYVDRFSAYLVHSIKRLLFQYAT